MKVAFLGATKGMGRSLARLMAQRGDELFLLGRGEEDLKKSASDLEIRAGRGQVSTARCDLAEPGTFAPALDAALQALGGLDTVVVTGGVFASQDALENDTDAARHLLTVNFANTVTFCEEARKGLLSPAAKGTSAEGTSAAKPTLCVFSSVAGERGRKPVAIYGASKAGLSRYLEALDHKFRAEGLRTVCVKPGFVKTGMTAGLKPPPFAGEPDQVAQQVLRAIDRGTPEVYTPPMWRWVMLVIRLLPRFVMRRINF